MSAEDASPERPMVPIGLGFASVSVLLLTGGAIGLFGGFLQALTVQVAGLALPVGAVLVIGTLVASIRAAVHLFDRRLAGVLLLVGWVVVSVLLSVEWPGGDVVISRSAAALVYLFGGVVLASAAANLPARLRPPPVEAPGSVATPESVEIRESAADPVGGERPAAEAQESPERPTETSPGEAAPPGAAP